MINCQLHSCIHSFTTHNTIRRGSEEFGEHAEIVACRAEVSRQAAVEEILEALQLAIQYLDQEQLTLGLEQVV